MCVTRGVPAYQSLAEEIIVNQSLAEEIIAN